MKEIRRFLVIMPLFLCLFFSAGCAEERSPISLANNSENQWIIGGLDVEQADPVASSIVGVYNVATGGICTGSLLESNIVLTAAHCVSSRPHDMAVLFGLDFDEDAPYVRDVSKVVIGPMWERRRVEIVDTGDIALVRFEGGLPRGYRPATLLTNPGMLNDGREVTIAGYGMSDGVNQTGTGRLRQVNVTINAVHFSKTEILLDQTQGRGACHGDSGGPAYVRAGNQLLLWGVTSRGVHDNMNDCSRYSAYTNVLPYLRWIKSASRYLNQDEILESSPDDVESLGRSYFSDSAR